MAGVAELALLANLKISFLAKQLHWTDCANGCKYRNLFREHVGCTDLLTAEDLSNRTSYVHTEMFWHAIKPKCCSNH